MAYRLSTGEEPVSRQLHRIFLEQIDSAISHLTQATEQDRDTRVHEARKDIKKIRALLRLVASHLGKHTFRAENHRFRDIARRLSPLRDAHAIIESVNALPLGTLAPRTHSSFVKRLETRKAGVHHSFDTPALFASVVSELEVARKAVESFSLSGQGYGVLETGLLSIYKRGRQALVQAFATRSPEDLHNLRKRVKDHAYQLRLLTDIQFDFLNARPAALRELETALGEAHNLHVLRHSLLEGKTPKRVLAALAARENELASEALTSAAALYRLKTRQLQKQLSALHVLWTQAASRPKRALSHKPPASAAHRSTGPSASLVQA